MKPIARLNFHYLNARSRVFSCKKIKILSCTQKMYPKRNATTFESYEDIHEMDPINPSNQTSNEFVSDNKDREYVLTGINHDHEQY